jgi:hypothetical protein
MALPDHPADAGLVHSRLRSYIVTAILAVLAIVWLLLVWGVFVQFGPAAPALKQYPSACAALLGALAVACVYACLRRTPATRVAARTLQSRFAVFNGALLALGLLIFTYSAESKLIRWLPGLPGICTVLAVFLFVVPAQFRLPARLAAANYRHTHQANRRPHTAER